MSRQYAHDVPPPAAHHHAECGVDCKAQGWCNGQTCGADATTRTAPGKCRRCRADDFNRSRRMGS